MAKIKAVALWQPESPEPMTQLLVRVESTELGIVLYAVNTDGGRLLGGRLVRLDREGLFRFGCIAIDGYSALPLDARGRIKLFDEETP